MFLSISATAPSCAQCYQTEFWARGPIESIQWQITTRNITPVASAQAFKGDPCDTSVQSYGGELMEEDERLHNAELGFFSKVFKCPGTGMSLTKATKPRKGNLNIVFAPVSPAWLAKKRRALEIGQTYLANNASLRTHLTVPSLSPGSPLGNTHGVFQNMSLRWKAKKRRAIEVGRAVFEHNLRRSRKSRIGTRCGITPLKLPQNYTILFGPVSEAWMVKKRRAMEIGQEFMAHSAYF